MGLEMTELVMACEEEFSIHVEPNAATRVDLETVGGLYCLIMRILGDRKPLRCPKLPLFLSLRRTLMSALSLEKGAVKPNTPLGDLLPLRGRRRAWRTLQQEIAYPLPPLRSALPTLTIGGVAIAVGIPLSLLIGFVAASIFEPLGYPMVTVGLFGILPFAVPAALYVLLAWCLRLRLPATTVGGLIERMGAEAHFGHGPDGKPWDNRNVWLQLQGIVAERFDVNSNLIGPETDFVNDLGAG